MENKEPTCRTCGEKIVSETPRETIIKDHRGRVKDVIRTHHNCEPKT